ncbi:MAG: hypothetical protein Q8R05_07410 [Candidatus Omnitrophota bacterium]|nr:hypothetical protein [Candidatus Omnitrophota bacterium]
MKKVTVLFLICLASVAGLVSFATAAMMPDYIYLFDKNKPDLTNWRDKFEDNASSNVKIFLEDSPEGKVAVIEGLSDKESFGCVYQDVTVDVNKYPVLEIDVNSASKMWYIIIGCENLKDKEVDFDNNKFVRLQFDTDRVGKHTYNLKALTGLSGEQTFRLKVGVATGDVYIPAVGIKMVFRSLKLVGTK